MGDVHRGGGVRRFRGARHQPLRRDQEPADGSGGHCAAQERVGHCRRRGAAERPGGAYAGLRRPRRLALFGRWEHPPLPRPLLSSTSAGGCTLPSHAPSSPSLWVVASHALFLPRPCRLALLGRWVCPSLSRALVLTRLSSSTPSPFPLGERCAHPLLAHALSPWSFTPSPPPWAVSAPSPLPRPAPFGLPRPAPLVSHALLPGSFFLSHTLLPWSPSPAPSVSLSLPHPAPLISFSLSRALLSWSHFLSRALLPWSPFLSSALLPAPPWAVRTVALPGLCGVPGRCAPLPSLTSARPYPPLGGVRPCPPWAVRNLPLLARCEPTFLQGEGKGSRLVGGSPGQVRQRPLSNAVSEASKAAFP